VKFLKTIKVLALEQATVVPYLTYRLAQDGVQVIRMEHPVYGDPNRLIGERVIDEDRMNAYFLCINSGKQAITLNLATEAGQRLLEALITKLDIDIFVTNQLPKNYKKLGIDYERLKRLKPDIIWMGITGFGADSNEAAYDPILQSRSGMLELTGEPDQPPQTIGVPLPDMGTSEHGYGLLMKALLKRQTEGTGSEINLSMFESSVSWLTVPIALNASFGTPITRKGNTHEFFCPVRVYETADGFVYVAVGNDKQWKAMVSQPAFSSLERPEYEKNSGRAKDAPALHQAINAITRKMHSKDLIALFNSIQVPVSKINTIAEVLEEPIVKQKVLHSTDSESQLKLTLAPAPHQTSFLEEQGGRLSFPPRFGEHNQAIYGQALGYTEQALVELKEKGVI
jgi:crotonobetainyl-CoA:carnitine CoA-transferase CaiB-like acyl-CoA transferase